MVIDQPNTLRANSNTPKSYFYSIEGGSSVDQNRIVFSCFAVLLGFLENQFLLLNLYYNGKLEMYDTLTGKQKNPIQLNSNSRIKVEETKDLYKELERLHKINTYDTYDADCFQFCIENTAFQRHKLEFRISNYNDYLDLMFYINKSISYLIDIEKHKNR